MHSGEHTKLSHEQVIRIADEMRQQKGKDASRYKKEYTSYYFEDQMWQLSFQSIEFNSEGQEFRRVDDGFSIHIDDRTGKATYRPFP